MLCIALPAIALFLALRIQPDPSALDPGVYLKSPGGYLPIEPEALSWGWGTISRNRSIVKIGITGKAEGPRAAFEVAAPAEFLIILPKSIRNPQFAFLSASPKKDHRDFPLELTWQAGVFHGWAARGKQPLPPAVEQIQRETMLVRLTTQSSGEYAFILSSFLGRDALPGDKAFAFRISSGASGPGPEVHPPADLPATVGVYLVDAGRASPLPSALFEWYVPALPDNLNRIGQRVDSLLGWSRTDPHQADPTIDRLIESRTLIGAVAQESSEVLPVLSKGASLILVISPPSSASDYRLVPLTTKDGARRLRLQAVVVDGSNWLGFGKPSLSPWPKPIPFPASRLAPHAYRVVLPELKPGNYALLSPGVAGPGKSGTLYAFEFR